MKRLIWLSVCMIWVAGAWSADKIPSGGTSAISASLPTDLNYRGEMTKWGEGAVRRVEGKDFEWAVALKTTERHGNFWSSVVDTPSTVDLAKNDVMLLTFCARVVQTPPKSKKGRFMSYFELPQFNHAKPLRTWTEVGAEWERVFFPFVMSHDVKAGKATLCFGMQDGPQEVEIADVQLLTYGTRVDFDDLPSTAAAGRPGNPYLQPWNLKAKAFAKEVRSRSDALEKTMFDTLKPDHPRIIVTEEHSDRLKDLIENHPDSMPAKYYPNLLEHADKLLGEAPLEGGTKGVRGNMLGTSRRMNKRMQVWGLAWRLSGDEKYAKRAREEMLGVSAFETWHPEHFLDVAEMTASMAIGYDWFHDYLDADARDTIRKAIVERGLNTGIRVYRGSQWWPGCEHNWNLVCNFGLIVGALAVADTDPEPARTIIMEALQSIPKALVMYDPDGAWTEGPGYWGYATRYTVYGLSALETALGKDFGLSEFEGFSKTGQFPIYTAGPTRYYMCFADCGRGQLREKPQLFYFARRYGDTTVARWEYEQIKQHKADFAHLMFYVDPPEKAGLPPLDLDRKYDGPVPVATFRSAWGHEDALFVGVKGGYNRVNHGHLDLGNFELDALGVRWALDLGGDSYSLPSYFSMGVGAKRWDYYRLNSKSHNVPEIAGDIQHPEATAKIVRYQSNPDSGFAVVDLTEGCLEQASRVERGVAMVEGRRSVLVQDEFELKKPAEIAWGITTMADVDLSDPRAARLTEKGKAMRVRLLSPAGARFTEESAEQDPPQKQNKGVRRLMIRYDAPQGETVVRVQFVPEWPDGASVADAPQAPLAAWK